MKFSLDDLIFDYIDVIEIVIFGRCTRIREPGIPRKICHVFSVYTYAISRNM